MKVNIKTSFGLKLVGAFLVAVLIGLALTLGWSNFVVNRAFTRFNEAVGRFQAQEIRGFLADYYGRHGGWEGIQALMERAARNLRRGGGRFAVLTDAEGVVIASSFPRLLGIRLSGGQLKDAVPIEVDGQLVGRVLVSPGPGPDPELRRLAPLEAQFRRTMNRAILVAGIAALLISLGIAALLARRLIRPLKALIAANRAVSQGRLDTRVSVRTEDEFGELARSFNEMTSALERLERNRRDLVADVAHELRTPIAALQANLESLQDGVLEPSGENLKPLAERTRLLARLVEDLHTLSLAEAGKLRLDRASADLVALAEDALETYRPLAARRGVRLSADLPDRPIPVEVDAQRIGQVLDNLLSNALRHTPEGGRVGVSVAEDSKGVTLSVRDTGPGLSEEALAHAFERFWRADRSRARQSGGSGLGLAIAKRLVEAHGGRLTAQNNPDRGARFTLTLPR